MNIGVQLLSRLPAEEQFPISRATATFTKLTASLTMRSIIFRDLISLVAVITTEADHYWSEHYNYDNWKTGKGFLDRISLPEEEQFTNNDRIDCSRNSKRDSRLSATWRLWSKAVVGIAAGEWEGLGQVHQS